MAITWNTGTAVSTGGAAALSQAVTIPAGVLAGDVLIVAFAGFGQVGGAATETIQASSTGTTPSLIGSSVDTSLFSSRYLHAAIFSVAAGASDAGKVITGSLVSGHAVEWAVALGAWTGASASAPVDVSGAATAVGNGSTVTCPSKTTGVAGDWDLQIMCAALGGASYTGGAGFTQRETVVNGTTGAAAAIFDSNGSVGGAGTGIGGAQFANAGNNSWWAGFTVGLAPAGAAGGTKYQTGSAVPALISSAI